MVGRGRGEQKWQLALISRSLNYLFGFCSSCFFSACFVFPGFLISHFLFPWENKCPFTKDGLSFTSLFLYRLTMAERPQIEGIRDRKGTWQKRFPLHRFTLRPLMRKPPENLDTQAQFDLRPLLIYGRLEKF